MKISFFFFSFFIMINFFCFGQDVIESQNQKINVSGVVIDKMTGYPLANLMIINKRTSTGIFGGADGVFSNSLLKNDTLIFSVINYETRIVCFKDSLLHDQNKIVIQMEKLKIDLQQVNIFPERTLNEIQKEIDDLGVDYNYQVQGFEAVNSPISYLYERFSRFEIQRKKAAELYNEEKKKELLKELFKKYIKADIINLNEVDFEDFIHFCHLPEEFIKKSTQYELTMAIKVRFEQYIKFKRQQE